MSAADQNVMQLEERHVDALRFAEAELCHTDFCPYLDLKRLFAERTSVARERFQRLFTRFYNLNSAGLSPDFLRRYFEILFGNAVIVNGRPAFETILNELWVIKSRKGYCALHFSFVSKMVAMHEETSPIYDRHVLAFFDRKVPATAIQKADRIAWFVKFLDDIKASYTTWASDRRIVPVLDKLKSRDSNLRELHPIRLMDFLVWTVGNRNLLHADQAGR